VQAIVTACCDEGNEEEKGTRLKERKREAHVDLQTHYRTLSNTQKYLAGPFGTLCWSVRDGCRCQPRSAPVKKNPSSILAFSGLSLPWTAFFSMAVPYLARIVPGAAFFES